MKMLFLDEFWLRCDIFPTLLGQIEVHFLWHATFRCTKQFSLHYSETVTKKRFHRNLLNFHSVLATFQPKMKKIIEFV